MKTHIRGVIMRIAICDDCKTDVLTLRKLVLSHPKINEKQVCLFISSEKLMHCLNNKEVFDIIFLDVDMPEINGIELGMRIREISPDTFIVFATNYSQYAIEAYDCEAFHYLLKPLVPQKVKKVLNSLINSYQKNHAEYSFKTKSGYMNIPLGNLYYVECCKKHLIFHMRDKIMESPGKLSDVYKFLIDYDFCQVHQGYVVNMRKIINMDKLNIYLDNDETVPISQRKKAEVFARYAEYLGENY